MAAGILHGGGTVPCVLGTVNRRPLSRGRRTCAGRPLRDACAGRPPPQQGMGHSSHPGCPCQPPRPRPSRSPLFAPLVAVATIDIAITIISLIAAHVITTTKAPPTSATSTATAQRPSTPSTLPASPARIPDDPPPSPPTGATAGTTAWGADPNLLGRSDCSSLSEFMREMRILVNHTGGGGGRGRRLREEGGRRKGG